MIPKTINPLEIGRLPMTTEELREFRKNERKEVFKQNYQESAEKILGEEGKSFLGLIEQRFEGTVNNGNNIDNIEISIRKVVENNVNINLTKEQKEELVCLLLKHIVGGQEELKAEDSESSENESNLSGFPQAVTENPDFPILKLALSEGEISKDDFDNIVDEITLGSILKSIITNSEKISPEGKLFLTTKFKKLEADNIDLPSSFVEKFGDTNNDPRNQSLFNLLQENYKPYATDSVNKETKNINTTIEIVFNKIITNKQFTRGSLYFMTVEKTLRSDKFNLQSKIIYLKSIYNFLNKPENIGVENKESNNIQLQNDFQRVQELLKESRENGEKKVEDEHWLMHNVRFKEAQDSSTNDPDYELEKKIA